jgi:hypothetical protein
LLGLILAALGGLILGRQLAAQRAQRAHRLDLWQRLLARRRGAVDAALLAARVQTRYEALSASRPRFDHRALRMHLERFILPGLALYQVLREEHPEPQTALDEWDELLGAPEGSPTRDALRGLHHMPWAFAIFRAAVRWQMQFNFPPEGWEIHVG